MGYVTGDDYKSSLMAQQNGSWVQAFKETVGAAFGAAAIWRQRATFDFDPVRNYVDFMDRSPASGGNATVFGTENLASTTGNGTFTFDTSAANTLSGSKSLKLSCPANTDVAKCYSPLFRVDANRWYKFLVRCKADNTLGGSKLHICYYDKDKVFLDKKNFSLTAVATNTWEVKINHFRPAADQTGTRYISIVPFTKTPFVGNLWIDEITVTPAPILVRAYRSAAYTMTAGATTIMPFDFVFGGNLTPANAGWDTTNHNWTCTETGWYLVNVFWEAPSTAGDRFSCTVWVNGVQTEVLSNLETAGTVVGTFGGSRMMALSVGDVLDVRYFSTNAHGIDVGTANNSITISQIF